MGSRNGEVIIKRGAPDWMVSFSDLNTLLLTFFILLLVFAKAKKAGCSDIGKGQAASIENRGEGGPYRGALSAVVTRHIRKNYRGVAPLTEQEDPARANDRYLGRGARATPGFRLDQTGRSHRFFGAFIRGMSELSRKVKPDLEEWFRRVRGAGGGYRLHIRCHATTADREPLRLAAERAGAVRDFLVGLGAPVGSIDCSGRVEQSESDGSSQGAGLSMKIDVERSD